MLSPSRQVAFDVLRKVHAGGYDPAGALVTQWKNIRLLNEGRFESYPGDIQNRLFESERYERPEVTTRTWPAWAILKLVYVIG